jgi:hypothetical protein
MAATKAICFGEPAQLSGSSVRRAGFYFTSELPPLWRSACLLAPARLYSQVRESRP